MKKVDTQNKKNIVMSGSGMVYTAPDTAWLRVELVENGTTNQEVWGNLMKNVAKAKATLKEEGVEEKQMGTSNIQLGPRWQYNAITRKNDYIDQEAKCEMRIEIAKIDSDGEKIGRVMDKLAGVYRLGVKGLVFDKKEKKELYSEARKMAFDKAKQKAEELAKMSGMKLGGVTEIREGGGGWSGGMTQMNVLARQTEDERPAGGGELATGELGVTVNLTVSWEMVE